MSRNDVHNWHIRLNEVSRYLLTADEPSSDAAHLDMSVEVKEEAVGAGPSSVTSDGKSIRRHGWDIHSGACVFFSLIGLTLKLQIMYQ